MQNKMKGVTGEDKMRRKGVKLANQCQNVYSRWQYWSKPNNIL